MCASSEKGLYRIHVEQFRREMQRRLSVLVARVDWDALLEHVANHRDVAELRGLDQLAGAV
jgi:hypothetical protein